MNLKTIFDQLSYGELKNVFLAENSEGEGLDESRKKQLLVHINMGLTVLYTRFFLKEGNHVLNVLPDMYRYELAKELPDLLRIERIEDLGGNEYPVNVMGDGCSFHTPSARTLVVPTGLKQTTFQLTYRANHPRLDDLSALYPADMIEVELPHTHLEPLLLYIASRVHNPIGMTETFHEGNNYAAKFEAACQQLERTNYAIDQTEVDERFQTGGWV